MCMHACFSVLVPLHLQSVGCPPTLSPSHSRAGRSGQAPGRGWERVYSNSSAHAAARDWVCCWMALPYVGRMLTAGMSMSGCPLAGLPRRCTGRGPLPPADPMADSAVQAVHGRRQPRAFPAAVVVPGLVRSRRHARADLRRTHDYRFPAGATLGHLWHEHIAFCMRGISVHATGMVDMQSLLRSVGF